MSRAARSTLPAVLVVEDDTGVLELLRFTLERGGYRTECVTSAEAAQRVLRDSLPNVVVLDWMLPGASGLQLAKQLRADPRTRDLPLLMVTARGEEIDRVAGLEGGADDYIVKPFSPKELIARVQAVLRRRAPELGNAQLVHGALALDTATHEVFVNDRRVDLTPAEFKLLRFFLGNPGRVYSRRQLLDQVWGDHVYVEERTVDAHIRRLRAALGPEGERAIETVRGAGYKLSTPTS